VGADFANNPFGNPQLVLKGAYNDLTNYGVGNLIINSNDAVAANKGGALTFGGVYTGTSDVVWAGISGYKTNATDGNYSGYLALHTRNSGSQMAERMRIDHTGKVGIGTTAPLSALQIADSGASMSLGGAPTGNGSGILQFFNSNSVKNWKISSNDMLSSGLTFTPSDSAGSNNFTTPTVAMRAGIVGINKTPGTGIALDVSGNIVVSGTSKFGDTVTASTIAATGEWQGGGTGNSWFSGNLGVGVTAPLAKLDVGGGIGVYSRTKAQIQAITPGRAGVMYFCSDCSNSVNVVVSTGTGAGQFATAGVSTTAWQ
jgi:hypothetical protein